VNGCLKLTERCCGQGCKSPHLHQKHLRISWTRNDVFRGM